jgi:hypothetical protein
VVLDAEPTGEPLWPGRIAAGGAGVLWRGEAVSGEELDGINERAIDGRGRAATARVVASSPAEACRPGHL